MIQNGNVAVVADFQDFMVNDGYGLRFAVFFKGCPLRCKWCQNPETWDRSPEIAFHSNLCIGCGKCSEACTVPGAIIKEAERRIIRQKCTRCMACVEACPSTALKKIGEQLSLEQVFAKIMRYKVFFDSSDRGGVTLTGGEPTSQPDFLLKLIDLCCAAGVHSAVDTCGYTHYEKLKPIAQAANLILFDLKHMNEARHIEGTGVSNSLILDNLKRLSEDNVTELVVRIPLIAGFNDNDENIRETAQFVKSLKRINRVDILPFNNLPLEKYKTLDIKWECDNLTRQSREQLVRQKEIIESFGLKSSVGGMW